MSARHAASRRWSQRLWLSPQLSVVGWLALLVAIISWDVAKGEPPCRESAPCTAVDYWVGAVVVALFIGQMLWLVFVPYMAWVSTAVLAVLAAFITGQPGWFGPAFAVACGWTYATLTLGAVVRWRDRAAGRVPRPAGPNPPRSLRLPLMVLAFAAGVTMIGLTHQTFDWWQARTAERYTATVLAHPGCTPGYRGRPSECPLQVRIPHLALETEVTTADSDGYPVGSTVTVLAMGSWFRLAAEPYDGTIVAIWGLLAWIVGVPMLVSELERRWFRRRTQVP